MICNSCRMAASLLSETEVIYQYLDGRPQKTLSGADAAREAHKGCREARRRNSKLSAVELAGSSWCDCQHVIPVRGKDPALTLD